MVQRIQSDCIGKSNDSIKLMRIIARLNVGGPAVHCTTLSSKLSQYGYETVLVTGQPGEAEADFEQVFGISQMNFKLIHLNRLQRMISIFGDFQTLWELIQLMKKERPQIVHTHTAKAGVLGRVAAFVTGVPIVVHTFHGHVLSGYFSKPFSYLIRWIEKILALKTTKIVTLSPNLQHELSCRFKLAPSSKFRVIPLGREISQFWESEKYKGELRKELGIHDQNVFLIGTLGRLVPIKDQRTLLKAFSLIDGKNSHIHLVICGEGNLKEDLKKYTSELGISNRVHFLGWRADLPRIYADLDCFVLSSKNEGTPLSIIESFASGCPVISTRVGGVPDMFHERTQSQEVSSNSNEIRDLDLKAEGILVQPQNPNALKHAIQIFHENRKLRFDCSVAAKKASHAYSVDSLAKNVDSLYQELLANP